MTNQVTYVIELTPENAPKIDAINRIVLGTSYTSVDSKVEATKIEKEATKAVKETPKPTKETKPETTSGTSIEDLKTAAKTSKKDHGEDFTMEVLKAAGVEVAATLGRTMSKVDPDMYEAIISAWAEGPQATEQSTDEPIDDLEDDGFGDELEESTPEVTADAVKLALRAYAKDTGRDEAKEIMQKHGAAVLSKVDDCSPKQLAAMMADLV